MRIATLNTHYITTQVLKTLLTTTEHLDIDIWCFQEIDESVVKNMSLNSGYSSFCWSPAGIRGNAVVSKIPFKFVDSFSLIVGSNEKRSAIKVKLDFGDKEYTIVNVHLDHMKEETRIEQFKILNKHLDDTDIIVGDFNALYEKDFSVKSIIDIAIERYKSRWELPKFDLMNMIEKDWIIHKLNGTTSRFDTRIDYILTDKKTKIDNIQLIETIKCAISDHNGIFFIVE